jgi:hypothetical protein
MASIAPDPDAKALFADAAAPWRDTARRIERLEDELAKLPKSDEGRATPPTNGPLFWFRFPEKAATPTSKKALKARRCCFKNRWPWATPTGAASSR